MIPRRETRTPRRRSSCRGVGNSIAPQVLGRPRGKRAHLCENACRRRRPFLSRLCSRWAAAQRNCSHRFPVANSSAQAVLKIRHLRKYRYCQMLQVGVFRPDDAHSRRHSRRPSQFRRIPLSVLPIANLWPGGQDGRETGVPHSSSRIARFHGEVDSCKIAQLCVHYRAKVEGLSEEL